jgi:hypothetical protein
MSNTNEQLEHRLAMIQDDLNQLRAFIYANNLAEAFESPTDVSDEAWTLLNNIEIACDLASNESLSWKPFNKITNMAPTGYYRKLLSNPYIRIAFTHTPIYGCLRIVDNQHIIDELKRSTDDYAKYYVDGLTNGTMITIVEGVNEKQYRNNGELYFTT